MGIFEGSISSVQSRRSVRQRELRVLIAILLINDFCILMLSFTLSYMARFWTGWRLFEDGTVNPALYSQVVIFFCSAVFDTILSVWFV